MTYSARTSALAGRSPSVPEPPAPEPTPAPETTPAAGTVPKRGRRSEASAQQAKPEPKIRKNVYLRQGDLARIEAARRFTLGHTGIDSFTEFAERAMMEKVERLEQEYNNGRPWT